MSVVPRKIITPKYGDCNCSCHYTGAKHVVPCCTPKASKLQTPSEIPITGGDKNKADYPGKNK